MANRAVSESDAQQREMARDCLREQSAPGPQVTPVFESVKRGSRNYGRESIAAAAAVNGESDSRRAVTKKVSGNNATDR